MSTPVFQWNRKVSLAPMMGFTDVVLRQIIKQFFPGILLFTEMVPANSIPKSRKLLYLENEHPIIAQLGGDDPKNMKKAAKHCLDMGYDGIDINVGCPSRKVGEGNFGVMLMKQKKLLESIVESMQEALEYKIPLSIKCRLGIVGERDDLIIDVLDICQTYALPVTIHARLADMHMNTNKNRRIPKLDYEKVYQLKKNYPFLFFQINGGITTQKEILFHINQNMPVMLGRALQHNPYFASEISSHLGMESKTRSEVLDSLLQQLDCFPRFRSMMQRHLPGLFFAKHNKKHWTASVMEWGLKKKSSLELLQYCKKLENELK